MRYLTLREVLSLYRQVMQRSGGALGVRDLGGLESALAQPRMGFEGKEFYSECVKTLKIGSRWQKDLRGAIEAFPKPVAQEYLRQTEEVIRWLKQHPSLRK